MFYLYKNYKKKKTKNQQQPLQLNCTINVDQEKKETKRNQFAYKSSHSGGVTHQKKKKINK